MTEDIRQFDTVRIPSGIPECGVPAGALATVLDVYLDPRLGYEIEVIDDNGRTLFTGAVNPSSVELVEPYGRPEYTE